MSPFVGFLDAKRKLGRKGNERSGSDGRTDGRTDERESHHSFMSKSVSVQWFGGGGAGGVFLCVSS